MIHRQNYIDQIHQAFDIHSVAALLGPRQSGKTTLAREYLKSITNVKVLYFDLEDPADYQALQTPLIAFGDVSCLIVIDEIQRLPNLFPQLRVLVDDPEIRYQFLILGSASRDLIRQSSETLAGRIQYIEAYPFDMAETGNGQEKLHLRGGFPKAFLAKTDILAFQWLESYIRTFLERDIPALGFSIPAQTLRRFWTMLAHHHGNILNSSELGRSLGVSEHTIRHYLDILCGTFMVRQLLP